MPRWYNRCMDYKYKAAIFDMDGTILDTIEDITDSLNCALARFGRRADYTVRETRLFFGSGARVAVTRALSMEAGESTETMLRIGTPKNCSAIDSNDDAVTEILDFYKGYYETHCAIKTASYPGIGELLQKLSADGIKTAVVSNKPDPAVQNLCRVHFPGLFSYAAGEKDGIPRKPAPDMIYKVLTALSVSSEEAVYIGDSEVDIETANRSGLDCISVSWGFRSEDYLAANGATTIAGSCAALLACIAER